MEGAVEQQRKHTHVGFEPLSAHHPDLVSTQIKHPYHAGEGDWEKERKTRILQNVLPMGRIVAPIAQAKAMVERLKARYHSAITEDLRHIAEPNLQRVNHRHLLITEKEDYHHRLSNVKRETAAP